jgi:hypothetical protein
MAYASLLWKQRSYTGFTLRCEVSARRSGAGWSLADLQRVIQLSFGWSDEYQHRFCIRNHCLGASRPGGLLVFGDPDEMPLSRFAFRLYERFTYEYNFFDGWLLDIRFEDEQALEPKRHYPPDMIAPVTQ